VAGARLQRLPIPFREPPSAANRSRDTSPACCPHPLARGLAVSSPGDAGEFEADTLASSVVDGRRPAPLVHAKPATAHRTAGTPGRVDEVLASPGLPLSHEVRAFMEPRFGQDFGHVRVHTDEVAAASADAIQALAFTHGHHIAFARGYYEPTSATGRALLAHELTHVVQQASGQAGIQRATHRIGPATISIDYGDVVGQDAPAHHQGQIESRYSGLTGRSAADISARVTVLTDTQRRWVVFALDLLEDNPAPGLDLTVAFGRLLDYTRARGTSPSAPTGESSPPRPCVRAAGSRSR
jgi:hypothetical protein